MQDKEEALPGADRTGNSSPDYQVTHHELEEADEAWHGNWIEIEHLRKYIEILEDAVREIKSTYLSPGFLKKVCELLRCFSC